MSGVDSPAEKSSFPGTVHGLPGGGARSSVCTRSASIPAPPVLALAVPVAASPERAAWRCSPGHHKYAV